MTIERAEELKQAWNTAHSRYNKMLKMREKICSAAADIVSDMDKEQGANSADARDTGNRIYWMMRDVFQPGIKKAFDAREEAYQEYINYWNKEDKDKYEDEYNNLWDKEDECEYEADYGFWCQDDKDMEFLIDEG